MRQVTQSVFALLMLILISGCAIPPSPQNAPSDEPVSITEDADTVTDAFPVTLEHKYGSTTVEAFPERVVTVGLTDQDALLALGVTPVGVTEWLDDHPGAIMSWAKDKVEGDFPEVVGDAGPVNFEKVAALNPDLILALYAGITEEEYALLSDIAPTVAAPEEYVNYGIPWQESTRIVGKTLGKSAEAEKLLAEIDEKVAQVRAEHPEFIGATGVAAGVYEGLWVYGPQDPRARFLTMLGFEIPDELVELLPKNFGGNISLERVDLLDVDFIVWINIGESLDERGGPVYKTLPVYTEGREMIVDDYGQDVAAATSFVTVLSLPYLLDELVPHIAETMNQE